MRWYRLMGRSTQILVAAVLLSIVASAAGFGVSRATFTAQTTNPSNVLTGLALTTPAAPTASTANACGTITVSWGAVTGATAYQIEAKTLNAASWTVLTSTATGTSYPDTTGSVTYNNRTVLHRVTALISGTTWASATSAASTGLACGVGEVSNLAVTNPCSKDTLTWTAAAGANNYDVDYSTTGGAPWTSLVVNQATVNYSDLTQFAIGANVTYQVTPGNGVTNGTPVTVTQSAWSDFRANAVTFANTGTLGTRNANDTVTVVFSKPALTPISGTNLNLTSIVTTRKVAYLAASGAAVGSTQIGVSTDPGFQFVNATITNTGTTTLSADGLTWTWTSVGGTANTMAHALTGTWATGTAVGFAACAADSTALKATAPTQSGSW